MIIKELYIYHDNITTVIDYGILDEDIENYKETHTIYKNSLWLNESYKNKYEKNITDIENVKYIYLIKTLI